MAIRIFLIFVVQIPYTDCSNWHFPFKRLQNIIQLSPRKTPSRWRGGAKTHKIYDLPAMHMGASELAKASLYDRLGNRQAILIWLSETLLDLCSYAYIPVMQTSQYRNRNESAWAWNFWLFRLWNRRATAEALVRSCHVIVVFDELSKQPFKMTLTKHYYMVKQLTT